MGNPGSGKAEMKSPESITLTTEDAVKLLILLLELY